MAPRLLSLFVLSWVILGRPAAGQDRAAAGRTVVDTLVTAPDGSIRLRPFVVPGSLVLRSGGRTVRTWSLDAASGRVLVALAPGTEVVAVYRAFPLTVGPEFRLTREPLPVPERRSRPTARPRGSTAGATLGGLRSRGAVTRGVTAGSGRDVSIESGLRLEIDGSPAPGVEVRAVLTDESTPIRPDGTTQRLSEFDRVSVEIDSRPGRVRLGDVEVVLAESRFAQLRRKVQGVVVESTIGIPGDSPVTANVQAAGAAARGFFRVQTIAPVDGLQGPYRLEGRNGELFVLLVPDSEIVYWDGERLERGATRDYTIDYATAEITFSPSRVVTADRRIEVEFTYSINQFTRTVLATGADAGFWTDSRGRPRARLGATWLRESDGSQFADEFGLSSSDSLRLRLAGDADAVRSGATEVEFDPEAPYVQYRREVRATGDTVYVALEAVPAPGETVYRVRFTRMGTGKGSYVREGQSVNGIVYAYRGAGRGEYDPVRILQRPELRRLFDLRGGLEPVRGLTIEAEWARSLDDRNRLSDRDSGDDVGDAFAGRVGIAPGGSVAGGRLRLTTELVRRSAHFVTFDRARAVEFGRNWNLGRRSVDPTGSIVNDGYETEGDVELRWSSGDSTVIAVEAGRLELGDLFEANRFRADIRTFEHGRIGARYALDRVETTDRGMGERGRWEYHRGRLAAPATGAWRPYFDVEREVRRQLLSGDSLEAGSIAYVEIRPGVEWGGSGASAGVEVERRLEAWPIGTRLERAAASWTGRFRGRFQPAADWTTSGEVSWRRRVFDDSFAGRADARDTRSLSLTWTGDGRPGLDRLRLGWLYQARTERSPTLQEVYFRAGPERGEYVWIDDNGDGVIQVDEFVPETTPDEGLYVRTYLPSDSLASVTVAQARLRLALDPGRSGADFASAVSGQTLFEVEERSRTDTRSDVYLLRLGTFRRQGTTLNGRVRFRQDLALYRTDPRFGVDVSYDATRALSELSAGIETRRLERATAGVRGRPYDRVDVSIELAHERNETDSDIFASRRFDLRTRRVTPSVRYRLQGGTSLRTDVAVAWKTDRRMNRSARVLRIPVTLRAGWTERADVSLRLELTDARVRGSAAGLAAWELTEGRGRGTSFLWGATVQWSVSRTLRATLGYDGRAPSSGRAIHTGRLEVSALF